MSLDKFLGTEKPPPEERCSNPKCRKKLGKIRFELTINGVKKKYCQECYKEKMKPLEENEASL